MPIIPREKALKRLIDKMHNGRIKIITGIRRCGKSYLLFHLFKEYLFHYFIVGDYKKTQKDNVVANKSEHPSAVVTLSDKQRK